MQNPKVSIVLSNHDWRHERLAKELQSRLENITLNRAADPSADLNYYIDISLRRQPAPTLEMGWIDHLHDRAYQMAREIALPVTPSLLCRDKLHAAGIKTAVAIPPGIDFDHFSPRLRIGVAGRPGPSESQGAGVISQLMDLAEIDWHFTESGWPLPCDYISEAQLPDFYRSLDFLLLPERSETAPISLVEALSVGTPVIAADDGQLADLSYIAFRAGDAADLRRILSEQLEIKKAGHPGTETYSWDSCAQAHERAFLALMTQAGGTVQRRVPPPLTQPVRLLMHGAEAQTLGGPSVRVPRTAEALHTLGVPAKADTFTRADHISEDITHLFNVWPPHSALQTMHQLKRAGKKVVFSPIYLDLSGRSFWHFQLPELVLGPPDVLCKSYQQAQMHQQGRGRQPEAVPGYHAMVREMLTLADHVIFLSAAERQALATIGATVEEDRASLVHNPVNTALWQGGDPALFRDKYLTTLPGPQEYVLCIGRIETRKNQLMLARAIRDLPLRLVLVGHDGDPAYTDKIRQVAGDQVLFVGRLDHDGDMMRSALAGARIFALPSWSEGASLAALEAAAAGANMVLSDRSSEQEYFGDLAQYCDPGNLDSIEAALKAALALPDPQGRGTELKALVARANSWERYAEETGKAYERTAKAPLRAGPELPLSVPRKMPKLVLDITSLAHHCASNTGAFTDSFVAPGQVAAQLAKALLDGATDPVFICWNDALHRFIEVPARFARPVHAAKYCSSFDTRSDLADIRLPEDSTVVIPGDPWVFPAPYMRGLDDLKQRNGCGIIPMLQDLAPLKYPFWFGQELPPNFRDNFHRLMQISDQILTVSQSGRDEVIDAMAGSTQPCPPVTTIRLGDPLRSDPPDGTDTAPGSLQAQFADGRFVLAAGPIDRRRNYDMLYRVWGRLADENPQHDLHLIILGEVAQNGQDLANLFASDPRVNGRVHVFHSLPEADRAWLYEHCLFTVCPAHHEGWSQAIPESLAYGKLCLAATQQSAQDNAAHLVEHIDPEDFAAWQDRISFYARDGAARAHQEAVIRNSYQPVLWTETAATLGELLQQPRARRRLHALRPSDIAKADNQGVAMKIGFGPGWHRAESWGRWSATDSPRITLNLSQARHPGQPYLHLLVKQKLPPHETFQPLTVQAGGTTLLKTDVTGTSFLNEMILTVPVDTLESDGFLTLDWALPTTPENITGGGSKRNLGIGLVSIRLLDLNHDNPLQALQHTENWFDGRRPAQIDFSTPTHRAVVAAGLSYHPGWGCGTAEGRFDLLLPILPTAPDQDLVLRCRPIATGKVPVRATFFWNGTKLGEETWHDDAPVELRWPLGAGMMAASGPTVLTVETDSLLSPYDLDIGLSQTLTGLGLTELTLTPKEA